MDLSTTYLGLELPNPFIAGGSQLTGNVDGLRRIEAAGAAAVVLPTFFEEHIRREQLEIYSSVDYPAQSFGEALTYFAEYDKPIAGPEEYLEAIHRAKKCIGIPLIASLNCFTTRGWKEYAVSIEQAGADALELDFFYVAADASESSEVIEARGVETVREVKSLIKIPVTVKLTPFYTSFANFARKLEGAGVDSLVLMHRFYTPDIDIEELELIPRVEPTNPRDLLLRLRWLAIVSAQVNCSLAVQGGVYTATDAIKAIMSGASAVQIVSAILVHGPDYMRQIKTDVAQWMQHHEYESLRKMRGNMNLLHCPDPKALSRANYIALLKAWQTGHQMRLPQLGLGVKKSQS
jgi:dihydroorotate dehydrogenase (fumarate)